MKSRKKIGGANSRKKVYRRTDDEWEGSSSGDVYDNTSYSENNDDDEYCSGSDGSDGSASETESSWTPTILAEEMRYREKGMGADDSEMMKEESYDEVDMLLMGFE